MLCGIEKALCFLKTIIIKLTVGPISFVFFEISKFVLVLALAFWITAGIFLMWESIMPEAAHRLSQAAEAVVANTSGLTPKVESKENINESGSYPFVVDIPKTSSSAVETQMNDDAVLHVATTESAPKTEAVPSNPVQNPSPDTPILDLSNKEINIVELEEPTLPLTPHNSPTAASEQLEDKPAETTE